jgi:hypothetical protein
MVECVSRQEWVIYLLQKANFVDNLSERLLLAAQINRRFERLFFHSAGAVFIIIIRVSRTVINI